VLYDQFPKFSKFKIQHFLKLDQQRKVAKPDKAPIIRYGDNHRNYPKPVHNIASNGNRSSEGWNKSYRGPHSK
jgi:hypothetical protein